VGVEETCADAIETSASEMSEASNFIGIYPRQILTPGWAKVAGLSPIDVLMMGI
jgi:hypothetical protein